MKWFFTEFFYLLSLLAIIYEVKCITFPRLQQLKLMRMKAHQMELETQDGDEWAFLIENRKFLLLHMGYTAWILVGLFTSAWAYFFLILLLSALTAKLREQYWAAVLLDACVTLILLLAIVAQHYHQVNLF